MSASRSDWRRANAARGPHQCLPRVPPCLSGNSVFYRKILSGIYHNYLRNRFQGRCKRAVRHSRRRIGRSYLQAGEADADESARKALAAFSETYWPPLYTFVRRRGYSPADAQDLVQGFFEHLLQQNTLSRADREKGRLRTFLLGSLQNFLLKQRERMSAMKRGGGQQIVSFDDQLIDAEAAMNATAHLSDVSSYDLAWASSVVTRAWKNVRERFAEEGKRAVGR